jgi:hypothetical protein
MAVCKGRPSNYLLFGGNYGARALFKYSRRLSLGNAAVVRQSFQNLFCSTSGVVQAATGSGGTLCADQHAYYGSSMCPSVYLCAFRVFLASRHCYAQSGAVGFVLPSRLGFRA